MKVKLPKPPTIQNIPKWLQKPGNVQRLIGKLFPLGQGGLRYPPKESPHDFTNDISLPYTYQKDYPGFQKPIFGEPLGEPDPYLEPRDRPQEGTAPRSGQKPKEKPKQGIPPHQPTLTLPEIPRADDLVEDVPPTHPVEESPEAEDEGEPKEPRRPRRRSPEYDAWNCETFFLLTGIPCPSRGTQIQIRAPKKFRSHNAKSKTYRKGRNWNYPF